MDWCATNWARTLWSGHLFLFTNRRKTRLKRWCGMAAGCGVREAAGKGALSMARGRNARSVVMRPEELAMLVNGLDLAQARPRQNWLRRAPAA